jgi:hypothetical protein
MSSNEEIKNQNANIDKDRERNQNEKECRGRDHRCGRHRMWKFPFIIAAVIAVKSALVLLLWNALIPEVFHGPELSYLQAIELTILVKILTGFGGGFRHRFGHHRRHHHHHGHGWGRHRERWMNMTPEEREKMRDEMRARCRRR